MAKENFHHLARHKLNLEDDHLGTDISGSVSSKSRKPSELGRISVDRLPSPQAYVRIKTVFEVHGGAKTRTQVYRLDIPVNDLARMVKGETPLPYGMSKTTVERAFKTAARMQNNADKANKSRKTTAHKPRRAAAADKPSRK